VTFSSEKREVKDRKGGREGEKGTEEVEYLSLSFWNGLYTIHRGTFSGIYEL
jgi:hypothetical protein